MLQHEVTGTYNDPVFGEELYVQLKPSIELKNNIDTLTVVPYTVNKEMI